MSKGGAKVNTAIEYIPYSAPLPAQNNEMNHTEHHVGSRTPVILRNTISLKLYVLQCIPLFFQRDVHFFEKNDSFKERLNFSEAAYKSQS